MSQREIPNDTAPRRAMVPRARITSQSSGGRSAAPAHRAGRVIVAPSLADTPTPRRFRRPEHPAERTRRHVERWLANSISYRHRPRDDERGPSAAVRRALVPSPHQDLASLRVRQLSTGRSGSPTLESADVAEMLRGVTVPGWPPVRWRTPVGAQRIGSSGSTVRGTRAGWGVHPTPQRERGRHREVRR